MIIMQVLVVLAFTAAAAVPIINLVSEGQGLDAGVIREIAAAVEPATEGELMVQITPELGRIVDQYPNFWFYAADSEGQSVRFGSVPEHVDLMAENLTRVTVANISDIGSPETPMAIIRQHDSAVGRLWIITAGGPTIGLGTVLFALSRPPFLIFIILLTAATFLAIPLFVGRQLRGVDELAAEANTVGVDQRGVRLSMDRVPTELHPMVRAVNEALQRLDSGMAQQQRFMADAAHELRTPIAILQTRLELLADTDESRRLLLDVARLSSMADQLLDLQRMDLSLVSFQTVNLVELASNVTADLAPLAIAAGDEIIFEAEGDKIEILGDQMALSRALANLIQNAIAHGGKNTEITIRVCSDGRVEVGDTGPGIDPAHREDIFEPFHRVAPLQHGAGLGLSLVRDIVQRHNGRVVARQNEGGGALFEILLPLARADN
ncbi:sensor histidine kinase [Devosia submarina]|uniref:sensor histidine kinase n=1 Tax=Devosia submarina TaxID=1173082 RepID=UPI001472F091|nr:HAMP domain-containing sensor histidine kinase [Devosia submarina]